MVKTLETKKEEIVLERSYIVPLRRAWNSAYHKRTKRAIRILKEFASRHMKVERENVLIDPVLNRKIWARGNANPPRKVHVVMKKTADNKVIIYDYEIYTRMSSQSKHPTTEPSKEKSEMEKEAEKEHTTSSSPQKDENSEGKEKEGKNE